jgi:hypothetical protein
VKENSKWCCKVENCVKKYNTKWLLTTQLKKMHSLATKKGFPSMHLEIPNDKTMLP